MALLRQLSPESLNLHSQLLVTIYDAIQTEHWQKMKVLLNRRLGRGTVEEKNFLEVSEILYERGFIIVGEYAFLENLLHLAGIYHLNDEIASVVKQIGEIESRHGEQSNTEANGGHCDRSFGDACENTEVKKIGAASEEANLEHAPIAVLYNREEQSAPIRSPRIQLRHLRYIPQELKEVLERFRFVIVTRLTAAKLEIEVLKQRCENEPQENIEMLIKLAVEACGNIDRKDCVVKFTENITTVEPYHGIPCEGAAIYLTSHDTEKYQSFGAYAKAGSAPNVYILTAGHSMGTKNTLVVQHKGEQSAFQAICRYKINEHSSKFIDIAALEVPSLIFKDENVPKIPKPVSMNLAGTPVYKTGAGSGFTEGIILGTDITIQDAAKALGGCIIRSLVDGENFARPGDSGSVVYSMGDNIPLCMIMGEMSSHDPLVGPLTFCIHLDEGLQALGAASGSEWTICSADDVVEKKDFYQV